MAILQPSYESWNTVYLPAVGFLPAFANHRIALESSASLCNPRIEACASKLIGPAAGVQNDSTNDAVVIV